MSTYTPDSWVVLEFVTPQETFRKVLAGWYGGYAGTNSWKLNSGIKKAVFDGNWWLFEGHSSSVYRCNINNYHMSSLMMGVYSVLLKQADERGDVKIRILDLGEVEES